MFIFSPLPDTLSCFFYLSSHKLFLPLLSCRDWRGRYHSPIVFYQPASIGILWQIVMLHECFYNDDWALSSPLCSYYTAVWSLCTCSVAYLSQMINWSQTSLPPVGYIMPHCRYIFWIPFVPLSGPHCVFRLRKFNSFSFSSLLKLVFPVLPSA